LEFDMPVANWSTSLNPTDYAKKSFASYITKLMPNGQAPLYGVTSMLKSETAYQPEHGFWTKTMIFPSVTLSAAVADGVATAFTVTDSSNMLNGMILEAETTREHLLVTAAPTGTSITVIRGQGTVAAAAIANGTRLYMVGNAYEEASVRPSSLVIIPVRQLNYTQIFRNTWLVSNTSAATSVIVGGAPDAETKQDCAMFHAIDMEKALLFGQTLQTTRNGYPLRCMNGLINQIIAAGGATTLGATTNYTQFEAALDPCFNQTTDPKNPNERLLLGGGVARRVMHNIARLNSQYNIENDVTEWGLQFDTFKIPRGRFNFVEHPLLNAFGQTAAWAKMAIAVDLASFGLAYMTGRNTQARDFNQNGIPVDNGIDAVGGTLTTEMTCTVKNPPANAQLTGFTAAAAG
jgi:hypothetical protein